MNFDENNIKLKLDLQKNTTDSTSPLGEKVFSYMGDIDYEKNVINKPKLNGKTIIGNIEEEDPSMQPIELKELNKLFDEVFN